MRTAGKVDATARLMSRRTAIACGMAIAASGIVAPLIARAQSWPAKPVTVVVPFAAGGNTDIMARMASQRLQERLGQTFVIENRVGAGGAIAMQYVQRAQPDGYTIVFAASPQIAVLPRTQKVSYDPMTDFVPVSVFGTGPYILGIRKDFPAKTLQEFLAYAKANPGKLSYASGGTGSTSHLAGALFVARAGLDIVHVPYKGGGPAVGDLVAGQVDMYFGNASEIISQQTSGIKMIAVATPQRMPQLPDVPAVAEVFPGFQLASWNGFMVPKGTPQQAVDVLAREIAEIAKEPAIVKKLDELGITPGGNTPAQFAETIRVEDPIFADAVKAAGMKQE